MSINLEGFVFDPPPGFRTEELTLGMRLGGASGPSPSLMAQTRPARPGATLDQLATETLVELSQTLGELKASSRAELTFADGAVGIVLSLTLTTQKGDMRQYFAIRLDKGRVCTLTLTVPASALNDANARAYMNAIASVRPS